MTNTLKGFTKPFNTMTLENLTEKGLQHTIKNWFLLQKEPIVFSSTDRFTLISSIRRESQNKVTFPVVAIKPSIVEIAVDSRNPKALYRSGIYAARNSGDTDAIKIEAIPIVMNYEVFFMTDSYDTLKFFVNRWLICAVAKGLNMGLDYLGVTFDVTVEPDSSITIPEIDMQVDNPNFYEMITTLRVNTYMSSSLPFDEMPKVPILKQINATVKAGEKSENTPVAYEIQVVEESGDENGE